MTENEKTAAGLIGEIKRGTLILSVLSQLKEAQYGYSLVQRLADNGLPVEQSSLYPLLRRLEKQGLLKSEWSLIETRPRRYYKLDKNGEVMLKILISEWNALVKTMDTILQDNYENEGEL